MMASVSGLLAFFFLTLAVLSPLRFAWIEKYLISLPQLIRAHHYVGLFCLVLSGIHATVLIYPFWEAIESPGQLISLLFDTSDRVSLIGNLSFFLFVLIIPLSFWRNASWKLWIWIHRLSVIAFVLVVYHVVLVSLNKWLLPNDILFWTRNFLIIIALLSLILLSVYFLRPEVLANHRRFKVIKMSKIAPNISQWALELGKGSGVWESGQFGFFRFDCNGICGVSKERHPFTIIGRPDPNTIEIVVKALGDDTTLLQNMIVGTEGEVSGPYGYLEVLLKSEKPQLWIAGGLGLIPFLGLGRRLMPSEKEKKNIVLLYFYSSESNPLFREELDKIVTRVPYFKIYFVETNSKMKIGIENIEALISDWRHREIAIAGPKGMILYWKKIFRKNNVPSSHIYTEDI